MRAKLPRTHGHIERAGVKIYYEIYGDGPETMVFVPPWSIVHSRIYKAQLPYFSERFRCIAYDGRGNGKSDRPADVGAYSWTSTSLMRWLSWTRPTRDAQSSSGCHSVGCSLAYCGTPPRARESARVGRYHSEHRARPPIYESAAFPGKAGDVAGLG